MYSDVEGVSDEYIGKLQRQAGPGSWSCSHYGWMAYPYSYNVNDMIGRTWHHRTGNNRYDSVGGRLSLWIRDRALEDPNLRWPKNHVEQRYFRTSIRKFIYLSHINSVLGHAQDSGYALRLSGSVLTILDAVERNIPWDGKHIESPIAKCSSLERHEESLISKAREWRMENPDGLLDPQKPNTPNYFVKFRGVVDRIQRDRGIRLRLHSSYLNQSTRMDKFVIANSRHYRYGYILESKIRELRNQLNYSDLGNTFFVPVVTPIHAKYTEHDLADSLGYTFDEDIKRLKIEEIVPHIPMASVKEMDRKESEEWTRTYEVIVPNKYNNDVLARANLVHPSSLPSDPNVISSTGDDGGKDDAPPGSMDKADIAKTAWKQVVESQCCRCGTKHYCGSVSRHRTCVFCWSPVCSNQECHKLPCKGLVAMAGVNMAAARESKRLAPTEFVVTGRPKMSREEHQDAITLATSLLKKGAEVIGSGEGATGSSRPAPAGSSTSPQKEEDKIRMPPPMLPQKRKARSPRDKSPAKEERTVFKATSSAGPAPKLVLKSALKQTSKGGASSSGDASSGRHDSDADVSSLHSSRASEPSAVVRIAPTPPPPPDRGSHTLDAADTSRSGIRTRDDPGRRSIGARFFNRQALTLSSASEASSNREGRYRHSNDPDTRERSREFRGFRDNFQT